MSTAPLFPERSAERLRRRGKAASSNLRAHSDLTVQALASSKSNPRESRVPVNGAIHASYDGAQSNHFVARHDLADSFGDPDRAGNNQQSFQPADSRCGERPSSACRTGFFLPFSANTGSGGLGVRNTQRRRERFDEKAHDSRATERRRICRLKAASGDQRASR